MKLQKTFIIYYTKTVRKKWNISWKKNVTFFSYNFSVAPCVATSEITAYAKTNIFTLI